MYFSYNEFKKKLNYYKIPFVTAFVLSSLLLFSFWGHGLINPDTLLTGADQYKSGGWEFSCGRYGWIVFDYIRGFIQSPVISTHLFLFFFCLSGIVFCELFNINNKLSVFIIITLISSSPIIAISNTYLFEPLGPACFFSLLSVLLVKKLNIQGVFLGAISLAFSLSIYQAYIGLAMCAALMVLLIGIVHNERIGKQFIYFIVMGIIGVVLYWILLKVLLQVYGLMMANYKGAANVGVLNSVKKFPYTIKNAYVDFYNFFFTKNIMINGFITISLNIILCGFVILYFVINCFQIRNIFNIIRLIVIFMSIPLACNFIDVLAPATRIELLTAGGMLVILPFAIVCYENFNLEYEYKFLRNSRLTKMMYTMISVLSLILVYNYALINNRDAIQLKKHTDKTINLANRLLYCIESNENYTTDRKILIIGHPSEGNYKTGYPYSILNTNKYVAWELIWNNAGGEYWCWQNIYSHYFGLNLNFCTYDEMEKIVNSDRFKTAPSYPEKESTFLINEILVIKISDANFL